MSGYVLGVDGGNTKTDYLLHTMDGALCAHLRAGTCSHEAIGMEGARREMGARIGELLAGRGLTCADVRAAAFGLAGVGQIYQKNALDDIVKALGFPNSVVMNDAFLGIKAGSESGVGVCSINGTGTAAGGIDAAGRWVQVGGMGATLSGDQGGGKYIASRTLGAVYDAVYRFGTPTALTARVLRRFGLSDAEELHCAISTQFQYGRAVTALEVTQLLFAASEEGDAVARGIVEEVAEALARSAAGCAVRLRFDGDIPVVLIGSVWTRGRHGPMMEHFRRCFERFAQKPCRLHVLEVPPAAGSVLWALELARGEVPDGKTRERVFADTRAL